MTTMRALLLLALAACGGGTASPAAPAAPAGPDDPQFLPRVIDAVAMRAVVPEGVDAATAEGPMGCVRFAPDGTVTSTALKAPSGDDAIDAAFTKALALFATARTAAPEPLPGNLRDRLAEDPLCFRLRFDP